MVLSHFYFGKDACVFNKTKMICKMLTKVISEARLITLIYFFLLLYIYLNFYSEHVFSFNKTNKIVPKLCAKFL